MAVSTRERIEALGRMRKRLAGARRRHPDWGLYIRDLRISIDALEILLTLDLKGANDAKKT